MFRHMDIFVYVRVHICYLYLHVYHIVTYFDRFAISWAYFGMLFDVIIFMQLTPSDGDCNNL